MKVPFLTSGLVFILSLKSFSQNGITKHFGVEDGLASNHIYAAFQDRKGYMWFATSNGVSRFDGKKFKNYTSNDGLPDNDIFGIWEDVPGRIWLSCYNGEPCYIYNDRVFTNSEDSLLKQLPQRGYFRFSPLKNKLILAKYGSNCYEINEHGKLGPIPLQGVLFLSFKKNLLNICISRTREVFNFILLDTAYKKVDSLFFSGTNSTPCNADQIEEIYTSGVESFVVLLKDGRCLPYKIRDNKIVFLSATQKTPGFTGVYHTKEKIWVYEPKTGMVPVTDRFQKDPEREILFSKLPVQNFMVDRQGNYWCCTWGKGLYMIPNTDFSYYHAGSGDDPYDILKLAGSGHELYLGCAGSILNYSRSHDPFGGSPDIFASLENKLVDLYADSLNVIAATKRGVLIINKKNKEVKKVNSENIKCMSRGPGNTILFGTHSGCFQFSFPDQLNNIFKGRTVAVHPRKNGNVLVGTLYGLFEVKKNRKGSFITDTIKSPAVLARTRISCLGETGTIIVAGTIQKGLVLIDGDDFEFVNLGPGLSNINCKSIFIEEDKTIWLSSFSGIFKIRIHENIHAYTVENIRKFNGLLSDDVNDLLVVHDTVYAAGPNGLSIFHSNQFSSKKYFSEGLYINGISVNGVPCLANNNEIRLPSDFSTLDLHFSAIDFKSPGNILFKFRLTGLQKDWHYGKDNFVHFEALPPGSYKFELWAMNAENAWTPFPATLKISIAPAWWQTSWFYVVLALSGTATMYFIIRQGLLKKHKVQMRENSLKRHVTELELRAIKAQINPHFVFNTLNAIQYFIINHENEQAETYLNRMADLLRKTLDFSDKTTVSLQAEINYLENYLELEKLRFDENFIFTITNKLPENKKDTEIPPMVLQPHIENALRHGFKNKHNELKKLDITFSFINKQLVCEVLDNGIGRKAASAGDKHKADHRSRGMELSHSKLLMYESVTGKIIKTDILDNYAEDKQTATGTLIRISIAQ